LIDYHEGKVLGKGETTAPRFSRDRLSVCVSTQLFVSLPFWEEIPSFGC